MINAKNESKNGISRDRAEKNQITQVNSISGNSAIIQVRAIDFEPGNWEFCSVHNK